MKSSYLSVCVCLLALFAFFSPVPASVYTWVPIGDATYSNTIHSYNWNDPANWTSTPGDFPNGADAVAIFPQFPLAGTDSGVNIYVNGAVTLGTLSVRNGRITGNGHAPQYNIYAGAGGSLNFQVTTGTALMASAIDDTYGETSWRIRAPVNFLSDTVINTQSVNPSGFNLYNGPVTYSGGIVLDSATAPLGGSGALIKTGPGALVIESASNAGFSGDVKVQQGYLMFAGNDSLGTGANAIVLGSPGEIGHLASNNTAVNLTRPIMLSGEGGAFHGNSVFNVNTTIGGAGMLLVGKTWGYVNFNNAADNTYVGPAYVQDGGPWYSDVTVSNRIFTGDVTIDYGGFLKLKDANNVGGTVTVSTVPGLRAPLEGFLMSRVGLKADFFPTLSSTSYGVISLEANTGTNINAALAATAPQLGNGYMAYGSTNWGTFTGASLQPNLSRVYRFVEQGGLNLDSAGSATGALTDVGGATSVLISSGMNGGLNYVRTYDTNDFTGAVTVNGFTVFSGYTRTGGSPFGLATGAVYLNCGTLELLDGGGGSAAKGDTTITGASSVFVQNSALTLNSVARSNRATLGIGAETNNWDPAKMGVNDKLYFAAANVPTVTATNGGNGMVAPWMVEYNGKCFLSYDAADPGAGGKGFIPATFTVTGPAAQGSTFASTATDVVNLPHGGTITGDQYAYAVRVAQTVADGTNNDGSLRSAGAGDILHIGSGGLIFATTLTTNGAPLVHTANIDFGGAEGVIYTGATPTGGRSNQINGAITGTNGLTVSSMVTGNHNARLYLPNPNPGLTGQITIDNAWVVVGASADGTVNGLGPSTNPIYLNNVPALNGDYAGGGLGTIAGGTIANNITLGPLGGAFTDALGGVTALSGQITGAGTAYFNGFHDVRLQLTNTSATTPNNWTGGTWVAGTGLEVYNNAHLGSGPIVVGGCGANGGSALILDGNTNITTSDRVVIQDTYLDDRTGIYINCSAPAFGSLEGNGRVFFSYGNTLSTLTVGANNLSTDFFGTIADNSQLTGYSFQGALVKTGSGTLTLWGDVLLCNAVTVNQGTLAFNGKLDSPIPNPTSGSPAVPSNNLTINTGGTLAGSGVINRANFTIAGGTLGGSLTINTDVTLNSGAINAGGTINGNLAVNAGTVAGTTAVTGNFTIAGAAAVTGRHVIGGNLAVNSGSFAADPGTTLGSLNVADMGAFSGSSAIAGATQNAGAIAGTHAFGGNYTQSGGSLGGASTFGAVGSPATVLVNAGSFSGPHTIHGNFTTGVGSSAVLATHNGDSASTLTVFGNVTLDHTTTLNFNLGAPGTIGGGINDLIDVTGNVSLDGTLNVTGLTYFGQGTYTLLTYTGTLTNNLTLGTMPTGGYTYSFTSGTLHAGTVYELNLSVVMPFSPGDTNHDGVLNSLDIDAIYHNFNAAANSQWKVTTDGLVVGQEDVTYELRKYFLTNYGDANLDNATDFPDFQTLLDHWQASGSTIGWLQGDFNGDYSVDFLDFQKLLDYWNPGGWHYAPMATPEPASLSLLVLGGLALLRRKK